MIWKNKKTIKKLIELNKTIAIAESCTGGLVAKKITDIPGASKIFGYGIVSYSNQAKIDLLKVKEETLIKHTAVSMQTSEEMASGVRKLSGADIGISTTGYAGGNTPFGKNGKVFITVDTNNFTLTAEIPPANRSRWLTRHLATNTALKLISELLKRGDFENA